MVNDGQNFVNVVCDAPLEETLYSTSRFMALKIMKFFQLNPITELDQDYNEWLEKRLLHKGLAHDHAFQGSRNFVCQKREQKEKQTIHYRQPPRNQNPNEGSEFSIFSNIRQCTWEQTFQLFNRIKIRSVRMMLLNF